jgi:hypothetical protein
VSATVAELTARVVRERSEARSSALSSRPRGRLRAKREGDVRDGLTDVPLPFGDAMLVL